MIIFNDNNFDKEVLESDLPVLVDFWTPWCGPCKILAPVVAEVAQEFRGKIKAGKLDVDKNPQTAQKYGVMGVPTMILFRDGKETKRIVGLRNKEGLVKELEIL